LEDIHTSDPQWFPTLADAYRHRKAIRVIDDGRLGLDPISHTLFEMARQSRSSMQQWTAALMALGLSGAGVLIVLAAIGDPQPTSKLLLIAAGGIVMATTGGLTAVHVLTGVHPPNVKVGVKGFEITW
jgi:hypothetical protein